MAESEYMKVVMPDGRVIGKVFKTDHSDPSATFKARYIIGQSKGIDVLVYGLGATPQEAVKNAVGQTLRTVENIAAAIVWFDDNEQKPVVAEF